MHLTAHQLIELRRAEIEVANLAFIAHTPVGDIEYSTAYWTECRPWVHRFVTALYPQAEGAILKADADLRRILELPVIYHQYPEPWNRPELWDRPAAEPGPIS